MVRLKGLSHSFCIQDILSGKVDINQVDYIETNTMLENEVAWENMFNLYSQIYWGDFPDEARKLVTKLRKEHRIFQPRLNGYPERNIMNGHWVIIDEHGRETAFVRSDEYFKLILKD